MDLQKNNTINFEPYLSILSANDLKDLLNNEDKFNNLFQTIMENYLKKTDFEKTVIKINQLSIAEHNLSREQKFNELKQQVQKFSKEGEVLVENVKSKQEIIVMHNRSSLQNTVALLHNRILEKRRMADQSEKDFLEGKLAVSKFVETYLSLRKSLHLKEVKIEKLKEMFKKRH